MNRLARAGLVFLGLIFVLIIAVVITAVVVVRRPFPQTDGRITLAGLNDEVHVYRDEYGIPHIYAQNEEDLFFAQGYIHAQDRFWQMEFWRHIGQGRIAEMVGEPAVGSDKFIRTMGWNRITADTVAYYREEAPEFMDILEAYSAGVNAYIEENRDTFSINATLLGAVGDPWEIEPWTPANTISWGVVMSDDLSGNWGSELNRAQLIKELGETTVERLLPTYPYNTRPVIAPTEALVNLEETAVASNAVAAVDWSRVDTNIIGEVPPEGFALGDNSFVGSNNWVVSGQHTASGMPLLANDPHLGIQMPAIWYEVGLHAPGWDVTGFSFAGVPGVIVGHNEHIAWGVTNVGPDVQDLYVEKINPDNPQQYEFMGEWEDMEVHEEVIKVNGGEDVVLEVLETRHGPIINEIVDGQSDVLAIKWTAFEPSRILQSVIMLNQAENYEAFRDALRYWDIPSQNVIYADVEGNIAYQAPGLIPIRKNGNGLTPVPGWSGEYEWEEWIPYEELPALFNPAWGYIVTANHAVVEEDYPYLLAVHWSDGDRGQRITEMIEAVIDSGQKITAADFARIQFDSKSLMAQSYVPLLEGLSSEDPQVQEALERLRGWDLQDRRDSVAAALYEIFYMHLVPRVLADEVGEENAGHFGGHVLFHSLARNPGAEWWDNVDTAAVETQNDILLQALADTVTWFEENVGGEMDNWTWGRIHTATFVSAPLGESGIGAVESLVNRGPFPVDGGSSTVNNNGWGWSNPAIVRGHPSMRMIVDMSDFEASQAVLPTGQSGHPYHPHYDDMIALWQNGEYHAMRFGREAVEEAAVDHLVLAPGE